jgi:transcriptional antiterminator RfaH
MRPIISLDVGTLLSMIDLPKERLLQIGAQRKTLTPEWSFSMSPYDRGDSWFLAQLKPNCANIADRNLKRQGFKTFLPMEETTRQYKGKFATVMRPLLPGYIFVAVDVARGFWRTINSTYGVTRLVSFGKEPTAVPLDLVSQLMLRCDAEGKLLPPKLLKPGDQVTLNKGPFANFVAEVEKIAPDRRVWVLMDIMGGQTRVAVAADQLRAV